MRAARQAGYQDGYRDGLVALEGFKQSFASQTTTQVGTLVRAVGEQLDALQQEMARALAASAASLARQVLRSELAARPECVAAVAEQAIDALLLSARHIVLRVHPDDHALITGSSAEAIAARGARLVADADDRPRRLPGRVRHRPGRRDHRRALAPRRRRARQRADVAGRIADDASEP